MKLLIVESPGKVSHLTELLGGEWKVRPSVGHICDLPQKEIAIAAPEFQLSYQLSPRGADVVKRLRAEIAMADEVYLGTDPDREGEAIAWHLREHLGLGEQYQRVTFSELTRKAVEAAMASPRRIDMQLVHAQEARRAVDRLVGYLVSPAVSRAAGERLSAGRVQFPAVRLIVEREREIRAHKAAKYFETELQFESGWSASWRPEPAVAGEQPRVFDRMLAERASAVRDLVVVKGESGTWCRLPPAPFVTSTLQQAGSVQLKFSPEKTMKLAQRLYEAGHITYMRTDNPNVSEESMPELCAVLAILGMEHRDERRVFAAPEGAQEGHPAITPTHWSVEQVGATADERSLYELIRLRALASQAADAEYATRRAVLEGDGMQFEARGRTLVKAGWLGLQNGDATEEPAEDEKPNPVPEFEPEQRVTAIGGQVLEKRTKAPKRYTEAALVRALERAGIGRPSTYAATIRLIQSAEKPEWALAVLDKRCLVPTAAGELLRDWLVGKCQFAEYDYTRAINRALDLVAAGERTYRQVVAEVYEQLQRELQGLEAGRDVHGNPVVCSTCGKAMLRRSGRNGAFWSCSGFPECKSTREDDHGAPVDPSAAPKHACPACGAGLRLYKSSAGKANWWGCSKYPSCKASFPDKRGAPDFSAKAAPRPKRPAPRPFGTARTFVPRGVLKAAKGARRS